MFTARLTGFSEALDGLADALREGTADGTNAAARAVADDAKANHSFENRTGDLEASIDVIEDPGSAHPDAPVAYVVATEDYASYVEERKPYLEPAAERSEGAMRAALEGALEAALSKRG